MQLIRQSPYPGDALWFHRQSIYEDFDPVAWIRPHNNEKVNGHSVIYSPLIHNNRISSSTREYIIRISLQTQQRILGTQKEQEQKNILEHRSNWT